ncbi:MAG TPA: HAD-IIIA family hydrolase, partial [Bdellovibrio sp.]|nr:HAD-IIIA family hydrolase [Bdellovibrio sp.]
MRHFKLNHFIEQLIADTVQLGGVLVFLRDHAPADFSQWLQPFQAQVAGEAPFVVRSSADILSGKFKTRSEDLIFFFEAQVSLISSLNSVLQGQRISLTTPAKSPKQGVDFFWEEATLADWTKAIANLPALLLQAKPLRENLSTQEKACLFLDRDDVVVRNIPYNKDPAMVELMPGVVEVIQEAHSQGLWVALVTNQSGLGRGRISWLEYKQVHQRMLELLAQKNCWIDECVWASFIENEAVVEGRLLASLRKPRA